MTCGGIQSIAVYKTNLGASDPSGTKYINPVMQAAKNCQGDPNTFGLEFGLFCRANDCSDASILSNLAKVCFDTSNFDSLVLFSGRYVLGGSLSFGGGDITGSVVGVENECTNATLFRSVCQNFGYQYGFSQGMLVGAILGGSTGDFQNWGFSSKYLSGGYGDIILDEEHYPRNGSLIFLADFTQDPIVLKNMTVACDIQWD